MKKLFSAMMSAAILCTSMELPIPASAAEIIDSGTIEDIDWTLDAEGTLSLSIDEWPSELPTDAFVQDGRIVTVRLGEDVSVADSAFRGCENLTAVYIAEGGFADVSAYAFNDCDALRMSGEQKYDGSLEMTIKENHKTTYQIGEEFDESGLSLWGGGALLYRNVFMNPDGTESQTDWTFQGNWDCFGEKPTSIDSSEFDSSKPGEYPIYGYLSSPNLCDLYGVVMVEVVDGEGAENVPCGENCYYTLDEDGTLTFGGTGAIDVGPDPSYDREKVKKIVIGKGITSVSRGAFWYLENLESITVENEDMEFEEITNQYANPFEGCTKLHMEKVESRTGSVEFSAGNAKIYYNIGEEFDPTGFTLSGFGAMCISFRYTDDTGNLVYETEPFAYGNWDLFPAGSYTKMTFDTSKFDNTKPGSYNIRISYNDPTTSETIVKNVTVTVGKEAEPISCGSDAYYTLVDDTLIIGGTGKLDDKIGANPQYVKKIVIGEGITELPCEIFAGYNKLEEVTLPNSLTRIGDYAFYECPLTEISIPDTVTEIGEYAFAYTTLTTVTLPKNVKKIGEGAFQSDSTKKIVIENPDCKLGVNESGDGIADPTSTLVFVKSGSAAEKAAKEQGLSTADISKADLVMGDANGDGELDVSDVILMARVVAEDTRVSLSEDGKLAADVKRDGKFTGEDTNTILRMIAKLE
ncbi:MAG: leucine-rich repeat protein [Oscillospiraceae bacterium]|nr:leucine-rich repeat protein [Oscillospiraceae bacterium]